MTLHCAKRYHSYGNYESSTSRSESLQLQCNLCLWIKQHRYNVAHNHRIHLLDILLEKSTALIALKLAKIVTFPQTLKCEVIVSFFDSRKYHALIFECDILKRTTDKQLL